MSCERNFNKARAAGRAGGISRTAGNRAKAKERFSWRGYAARLRSELRPEAADGRPACLRGDMSAEFAATFSAGALADERAGLLVSPPGWLSAGERVARIAVLGGALALMRRRGDIDEAQYQAALIDTPWIAKHKPERSMAPVSLLAERPVGAEAVSVSRVNPGRTITTRYRLLDLDEPVASNLSGGAVNPEYDEVLQPRRRDRAASAVQIATIAAGLEPSSLLKGDAGWDDGPPIINQDGMVESGNGRVLALRRAAEINPEGYADYRRELTGQAVTFGFDRTEVAGPARPLLVRERLTAMSRNEQLRFIAEANSASSARMGAAEQARADAALLPPGFFVLPATGSPGGMQAASVAGLTSRFLALLPGPEQAGLIDSRGEALSAEGEARIERAMFAVALPGASGERLSRLIYEESEAINRVGAGLKKALPGLAALEDGIRAGHIDPALRVGDDLAAAIEKMRDIRKRGLSVNDYLRQGKFLAELNPLQEQLLVQLDARHRSGRAVAELLNAYTDAALSTPSPDQARFPGALSPVSPADILRTALKETGGAWVDASRWSAAQNAISGFGGIPATEIEKLNPGQQKLGALVANNVSGTSQKRKRGGNNWQKKWQIPAGGNSKKVWAVAVDDKGRWGCSCPSWIYQRKPADAGGDWWRKPCRHIEQVQASV